MFNNQVPESIARIIIPAIDTLCDEVKEAGSDMNKLEAMAATFIGISYTQAMMLLEVSGQEYDDEKTAKLADMLCEPVVQAIQLTAKRLQEEHN